MDSTGRQDWLAVTKDKNIRYRQSELAAIKAFEARVFVIRAKNVTADEMAEILIRSCRRMKKFAIENIPPFVAAIHRDGSIKLYPLD